MVGAGEQTALWVRSDEMLSADIIGRGPSPRGYSAARRVIRRDGVGEDRPRVRADSELLSCPGVLGARVEDMGRSDAKLLEASRRGERDPRAKISSSPWAYPHTRGALTRSAAYASSTPGCCLDPKTVPMRRLSPCGERAFHGYTLRLP